MRPISIISLFTGLGLLVACGAPAQAPTAPPAKPEVGVIELQPQSVPLSVSQLGRVIANRTVDITTRVSGIVVEKPFTEGSKVAAGSVLYRIDPREFQANLDNAKARVAQADSRFAQATQKRDRLKTLAGTISQQSIDDAETEVLTTMADLQAAHASASYSQLQLDYTIITAPFAGRVGLANRDVGALIGPSDGTLVTIDEVDPVAVEFSFAEREFMALRADIRAGRVVAPSIEEVEVKATLADGTLLPRSGRISFRDVRVQPETASARVRALLPNPSGALVPGMFTRVSIHGLTRPAALLVPQTAVQQDQLGARVLVLAADGKVVVREVELGSWAGPSWLVLAGLTAGERIIVDGLSGLRPGMEASARTMPAATAAAAR